VVGLFVNATEAEIDAVVRDVPLTMLQFHGDETPQQCEALGARGAAAVVARGARRPSTQPADLVESDLHYSKARGLLFDTLVPDYGGSGKVFDWSLIPAELAHRAVLSGGLNAQNVGDAIRRCASVCCRCLERHRSGGARA
jgi:phosphoribosylanthranilate isomerase